MLFDGGVAKFPEIDVVSNKLSSFSSTFFHIFKLCKLKSARIYLLCARELKSANLRPREI